VVCRQGAFLVKRLKDNLDAYEICLDVALLLLLMQLYMHLILEGYVTWSVLEGCCLSRLLLHLGSDLDLGNLHHSLVLIT